VVHPSRFSPFTFEKNDAKKRVLKVFLYNIENFIWCGIETRVRWPRDRLQDFGRTHFLFLSQGSKGSLAVGALETSRLDVGGVTGAEGCDGSAALGGATAGIDPGTAEGGAQAGSVGGVRGAGLNTLAFGEGLE